MNPNIDKWISFKNIISSQLRGKEQFNKWFLGNSLTIFEKKSELSIKISSTFEFFEADVTISHSFVSEILSDKKAKELF